MGLFDGLTSLVGGGYRVKAPTASPYRANQTNALAQTGAMYGAYANNAANATGTINRFTPGYDSAVQSQVDQLQKDPFTDAYKTKLQARAAGNVNASYDAGQSHLSAQLAARGIGGGAAAGALGTLENNRVGANIGAGQDVNDYITNFNDARPGRLTQFLGGVINNAQGDQQDALQGQMGVNNALYTGYGQLAGSDEARQAQYQQLRLQQDQSDQAPYLAVIGAYGQYLGARR